MKLTHKPRLGLALSGGGARGIAHIGVLKALERANIQIDYLAGTSMGGLISAVYAAGLTPAEIESIALEYRQARKLLKLADPTIPRQGLFHGKQMHVFFEEHLKNRKFSDLRIPLTLVAVDLNSRKEVHLNEGSVADAVRATVSIPGVFTPIERDGQRLVDGGLLNNLPVDIVREMGADIVLAVDINAPNNEPSFWQLLGQKRFISSTVGGSIAVLGDSLELLMHQNSIYKLEQFPPDFLIEPSIPSGVTILTGFDRAADLIKEGEVATEPILADLEKALRPRFKWRFSKHAPALKA